MPLQKDLNTIVHAAEIPTCRIIDLERWCANGIIRRYLNRQARLWDAAKFHLTPRWPQG